MNLDQFHNRTYNAKHYNCMHFMADVWLHLTNIDIRNQIESIFNEHKFKNKHMRVIQPLNEPVNPCIAVMKRPRSTPHVGIYIDGRILHLTELGVECFPVEIAMRGFSNIRYFK